MSNLFKVLFVFISFCQVVNGSSCDESLYRSCTGKAPSSRRPFSDISNVIPTNAINNKRTGKENRSNCYKSFIESAMVEKENNNNRLFKAPKNGNLLNNKNDSESQSSSKISIGSSSMVGEYKQFFRDYKFTKDAYNILENKFEELMAENERLKSFLLQGNALSKDLGLCPNCNDIFGLSVMRSNRKNSSFIENEKSLIEGDRSFDLRSSFYSDDNVLEKPNKLSLQSKVLDEKIVSKTKLGFFKKVKNGFCNFFKNTFSAIKRIFVR